MLPLKPTFITLIGLVLATFIYTASALLLDAELHQALGATTMIFLSALGYGLHYTQSLNISSKRALYLISIMLGLAALSLGTTLLGFCQILHGTTLALIVFPGIALLIPKARSLIDTWRADLNSQIAWSSLMLAIVICIALFITIVPSILAPLWYDGLVYHLALPKYYWLHGGITQAPHNFFSFFPQAIEMLYLLALGLGGELAPRLLNGGFGVLTLFLLYEAVGPTLHKNNRMLSVLLIMGTPYWYISTQMVFIENAVMAFVLVTLILFEHLQKQHHDKTLCALGLFCGTIIASKYNAAALIAPFIIWMLYHVTRENPGRQLRLFCIPMSLAGLPWYIHNMLVAKNPLAPFIWGYPSWSTQELHAYQNHLAQFGLSDAPIIHKITGIAQALIHPELFQGLSLGHGTFLLLAIVLMFYRKSPWQQSKHYWFIALWGALLWTFTSQQTRLLLPVEALLIVAVMRSFASLTLARPIRVAITILLVPCVTYGFYSGFNACEKGFSPWQHLNSSASQENYIRKHVSSFNVTQIANRLPKNAQRTLLVGETRTYYMNRAFIPITGWNTNPLVKSVQGCRSSECVKNKLRDKRIDSIIRIPSEETRLQNNFDFFRNLNKEEVELYYFFFKSLPAIQKQPGGPALYLLDEKLLELYSGLNAQS